MRLLINAIPLLGEESGIGNYARQIAAGISQFPQEFDITYFYGYCSGKLIDLPKAGYGSWLASLRGMARKVNIARRLAKKALRIANSIANVINPREWDCYFEPNFVLLPNLAAKRKIITLHDFSCFRYPQWHPVERVRYMEKFFWKSVASADHIITVSETIRQEAAAMFGIRPERMTAIPNGVDLERFQPQSAEKQADLARRYGLPENFILYVGTLEPRKNLGNLLRAYLGLPIAMRDRFPLLLIGSAGWNNDSILDLIRANARFVRILGYVPLADLPTFYSAASLFVYPSWYEGFGLPALEAMACGCPVLTSTDPALVELCKDAATLVAPGDVASLGAAMHELLEDAERRTRMTASGLAVAGKYGWENSVQKHRQIFLEYGSPAIL